MLWWARTSRPPTSPQTTSCVEYVGVEWYKRVRGGLANRTTKRSAGMICKRKESAVVLGSLTLKSQRKIALVRIIISVGIGLRRFAPRAGAVQGVLCYGCTVLFL